jgi:hypothetical protein
MSTNSRDYGGIPLFARPPAPATPPPAPATPPPAPATPYKSLGYGSFGSVITPAIPNFNTASGTWRTFPNNVTKLFYRKNAKNKALEDAERINSLMGSNNGHRVYNYTYHYKSDNIPGYNLLYPPGKIPAPGENMYRRFPKLSSAFRRCNFWKPIGLP